MSGPDLMEIAMWMVIGGWIAPALVTVGLGLIFLAWLKAQDF